MPSGRKSPFVVRYAHFGREPAAPQEAMIQAFAKKLKTEAAEMLAPDADATPAQRLSQRKAFLKHQLDQIQTAHREGAAGLDVARAISLVMDALLESLVGPALAHIASEIAQEGFAVAVVGIGGYGRAELCPLSDIDLMFLYPNGADKKSLTEAQAILVNEALYPLWDLGVKVGHSSRTLDEAFREAKTEIQTKTALLEARLIAGSQPLFDGFRASFQLFCRKDSPKEYIQHRLADQAARRAKQGGTVFMQEPDIKNGVGGLRDYHNTLWMAQVALNARDFATLAELNYIRKQELKEVADAYDFLLRARNELHFRSKRPTDLLALEVQPKVALRLGYTERNVLRRVEEFMRDYYKNAQVIYRASLSIESRLSIHVSEPRSISPLKSMKNFLLARRKERVVSVDGFLIRGQEVTFESRDVFEQDPERLIRIFRHKQQHNVELDIELSAQIRASLALVDDAVRNSPQANLSFKAILEQNGDVYPTLAEMHELGVLGQFIPEFGKLTCLVQHEYYHRYTADIHTLQTIRELDGIFASQDPANAVYREALHALRAPGLLYLILLLHDIGKARSNKDHAETGVAIAEPILQRLNVGPEDRALARYIIKNHLNMARFWQRFDVDDPESARVFAEYAQTPENLRLLFVHTYCDARGTAKGLWNNHKDALHTTLYRRAMDVLKADGKIDEIHENRKKMTQIELLKLDIDGVGKEEIDAHFKLLPDRYFINTSTDEIVLHIQMVNQLLRDISSAESVAALQPVIDWRKDLNRSLTVVNVVTWDRAGLFYKLAGAMNLAGYSILSAKAVTRDDHIAIDTFFVTESSRANSDPEIAKKLFADAVTDALISNKDLYPRIRDIMRKEASDIFHRTENPLAETFQPRVEVYHELSLQRTILEVQAPDHLGLLYQIAHQIFNHGYDITFARINTERGIAIDTLYLSAINPKSEANGKNLMALRESLNEALADDERQAS